MRVLIVKTSSIGDVIHTLPAVTDAARAIPGIRFDWVIEEGLAEIADWHPAVERTVPIGLRRWRRSRRRVANARSAGAFVRALRDTRYDAVIDAQGLYKSAVLAALARGPSHGLGFRSAREPAAAALYRRRHEVPRDRHAVDRVRRLFAHALGYDVPEETPDFAIAAADLPPPRVAGAYVVLLHGTVWPTKRWPVTRWRALAAALGREGRQAILPWATPEDRARARAIAEGIGDVRALETPTLSDAAGLIREAEGVAAVDTGLGHLAAAFGVPVLTLYGPTSPALVGTVGPRAAHRVAELPCSPCRSRRCRIEPDHADGPPCLAGMDEAAVLAALPGDRPAAARSRGAA